MNPKKIYLDPFTVIDEDALTMPESVPVTMGFGGPVVGSVSEVSFRDGDINVTAEITDPYVSEKLFGAYSAGGFSIAPTPTKLCYFCGVNKCGYDEPEAYFDTCRCCVDGHVQ